MATYKERWKHALQDDPNLMRFLNDYRVDLEKELRLLLNYQTKIQSNEATLIKETARLEKELLAQINSLVPSSNSKEHAGYALRVTYDAIDKLSEERTQALKKGDTKKAVELLSQDKKLHEKIKILRNAASSGGLLLDVAYAKQIEQDIRALFRHYLGLFSFLEYAINRIDLTFNAEKEKIIPYEKKEKEFIDRAHIALRLDALKTMKRAENIHVFFYKNLVALSNETKKLKDFIEAKLNAIEKEFKILIEQMVHVDAIPAAMRASKSGNLYTDEHLKKIQYADTLRAYSNFLSRTYEIIKTDEEQVITNRDKLLSVLKNAYFQLARQKKLAA